MRWLPFQKDKEAYFSICEHWTLRKSKLESFVQIDILFVSIFQQIRLFKYVQHNKHRLLMFWAGPTAEQVRVMYFLRSDGGRGPGFESRQGMANKE